MFKLRLKGNLCRVCRRRFCQWRFCYLSDKIPYVVILGSASYKRNPVIPVDRFGQSDFLLITHFECVPVGRSVEKSVGRSSKSQCLREITDR